MVLLLGIVGEVLGGGRERGVGVFWDGCMVLMLRWRWFMVRVRNYS